ncbi:hypothetical protein [Actimicrobium sp. GrIS 1.19]|uniref:hypothetical protein n=1 Tax=Actimicrobium sp. GrIS 1.19 TaxID=3071708 RepID=UPI002E10AE83
MQVGPPLEKPAPVKQLKLPDPAISALTELETLLENSPRNATLLAAIHALVKRPRA